jgi:chemotaxis protein MotB
MPAKKKYEAHINHERWLVSYADFITLLFAFFVVLFSSSQVDHRKITKLAEAIQSAFQQLGIFQNAYTRPPLSPNGSIPVSQMRLVNSHVAPEQMFGAMAAAAAAERERRSLEALRRELEAQLAPEIRRNVVAIVQNREGLIISLREIGFYASGSATLKPSSLPAVRRIAMILRNRPEAIRFEGHTDNVPIHNAKYASNWELSVARATKMLRLFITKFHFQPARLSAAGYGQYHPVASNATPAGRALNRRVDIVVLAPRSPLPILTVEKANRPQPAQPSRASAIRSATRTAKPPDVAVVPPPFGLHLGRIVAPTKPGAIALPSTGKPKARNRTGKQPT